MAYELKTDYIQLDKTVLPSHCASDGFVIYPQPSSLNYVTQVRPTTMVYGTAPYMAGKGAPNNLILVEDELRPQTTTRFNHILVEPYKRDFFPLQDVSRVGPQRVWTRDPASSRADLQNALFTKSYCKK